MGLQMESTTEIGFFVVLSAIMVILGTVMVLGIVKRCRKTKDSKQDVSILKAKL